MYLTSGEVTDSEPVLLLLLLLRGAPRSPKPEWSIVVSLPRERERWKESGDGDGVYISLDEIKLKIMIRSKYLGRVKLIHENLRCNYRMLRGVGLCNLTYCPC